MPEVPPLPRTGGLTAAVEAVFADDGPLAGAVHDFESRPGQREMAGRVARVFDQGGVLLAEAGTGTGKTLAYLVPAVLSGHRVLVSTGTKNLQEQIFHKDLPLLREVLPESFTATYMKGRGNYLCLHRYDQFRDTAGEPDRTWIPTLDMWAAHSPTGDRAELDSLPEDLPFWPAISASADNCTGKECSRFDDCFVTRMRQRAAESDIVIVNHHLLCADAAVRHGAYGEVIPSCAYAVVDEAHQLEDVATQYFGLSVSQHRLDDLVRDGDRCLGLDVLLEGADELRRAVDRVRDRSRVFFTALAEVGRATPPSSRPGRSSRGADERVRVTTESLAPVGEPGAMLVGALEGLEAAIQLRQAPASDTGALPLHEDLLALSRRAAEVREQLRFLLKADDADYVYFLETRMRGPVLRAAPIDVSSLLRETLFDRMQATVLTSATLTVDGSFQYVRDRLGVDGTDRPDFLQLPSEFDYATQTILYLPPRMPDPRTPAFARAVAQEVREIVGRTAGRAFVLFTSYAMLDQVRDLLAGGLSFPLLVQGTAPRSTLLDRFRDTPHAVLLATSSFWQGVDVMGDALSCVIVDKLPFASPGDPITAARLEAVRLAGGNPFEDYQTPLAILTLLQGLGRLIRHRRDRGVLAVLDPRLQTRPYGRRFLASLPASPVTRDVDDIRRFFA